MCQWDSDTSLRSKYWKNNTNTKHFLCFCLSLHDWELGRYLITYLLVYKQAVAAHKKWACMLSLTEPFNVSQTVNVKCSVNGPVVAISSWLVWLGWPALCVVGSAIFYSCRLPVCLLLVSVYLWITPCLLVCMSHSNCCLIFLLNKHLSWMGTAVQMRKRHLFTHRRLYGKGVLDLVLVCLFSKNIIMFAEIGSNMLNLCFQAGN